MAAHGIGEPGDGAPAGPTWLDRFYEGLGYLAGVILAVMAGSVFLSVVMRFFGSQAIGGLDEIPRYLFVWLVAIGGAAAMHRNEHTVLDYFVNLLAPRPRALVQIAANLVLIWLFLYLLKLSFTLVPNSALQTSPSLGLRLDYVFMAVPVGAVLIIIPLVRNILQTIASLWPKRS